MVFLQTPINSPKASPAHCSNSCWGPGRVILKQKCPGGCRSKRSCSHVSAGMTQGQGGQWELGRSKPPLLGGLGELLPCALPWCAAKSHAFPLASLWKGPARTQGADCSHAMIICLLPGGWQHLRDRVLPLTHMCQSVDLGLI